MEHLSDSSETIRRCLRWHSAVRFSFLVLAFEARWVQCLFFVEKNSMRSLRDRMVDSSLNTCYAVINNHGYYCMANEWSDIVLTLTEYLRPGAT